MEENESKVERVPIVEAFQNIVTNTDNFMKIFPRNIKEHNTCKIKTVKDEQSRNHKMSRKIDKLRKHTKGIDEQNLIDQIYGQVNNMKNSKLILQQTYDQQTSDLILEIQNNTTNNLNETIIKSERTDLSTSDQLDIFSESITNKICSGENSVPIHEAKVRERSEEEKQIYS